MNDQRSLEEETANWSPLMFSTKELEIDPHSMTI